MDFNINEFMDAFIEESKDNLETFNEEIIELEKDKSSNDIINNIFRVAHTLKGMAGSMGFEKMRSLTHTMEDLLQDARDNKISVTTELVNLLFNCHDYLEKCVNDIVNTSQESPEEPVELITKLKSIHENNDSNVSTEEVQVEKTSKKVKKATKTSKTTKAKKIDDSGIKLKDVDSNKVYDLSIQISGDCKLLVARMYIVIKSIEENSNKFISTPTMKDLENSSIDINSNEISAQVECDDIDKMLEELKNIPEIVSISSVNVSSGDTKKIMVETSDSKVELDVKNIDGGLAETNNSDEKQQQALPLEHHKVEEYLKIAASKVDSLADMVGELMISQSLVEQRVYEKFSDDATVTKEMGRMSRLTKDIQNLSMSLRMVPLKSTLQKVIRTGRDTAQTLNKEVTLDIIGEETEIDRTITEKLYTPLMHMVRNSIGHGIEEKEKRLERGKDLVGHVTISAYNKRGNVYIEIEDDGNGLNLDKILEKAIEKGLASSDKKYSDEEIASFIFLPGFSTAEKIDNISGRGVGMDVVKTDITKIGGTVKVDTTKGEGTKFTLKIPINLAIMNGTIVEIMNQAYILPTLNIREIVNVKEESWISIKGKEKMLKVRGEVLPIYPIKSLLKEIQGNEINSESAHDEKLMMIIELDDMVRAIPVQNVLERREIVVKSLDSDFNKLDFISGASILGDGTVALIFDVEGLLRRVD